MKKVVIGMSGGVDSSVAAHLLLKEGYEVIGLYMRNWDSKKNQDILGNKDYYEDVCPQEEDFNDALLVADKLGIKLHKVNFVKEYWDYVFSYFLDELKKGRTPNPDVMCNRYIKFDLFKKEAEKYGADFIATGHYAKLKDNKLYRAKDIKKDQTYFLSNVKKEAFKNVLFPLADYTKEEVREIAEELNLATKYKKDSTGICFIGERNFSDFVKNYINKKPGNIVNIDNNEVIGKHDGLMFYTIGQRRNIGISGFKDRHYVVGKNLDKNELYIAFKDDNEYLYSDECILENLNFIADIRPTFVTAKFRYMSKEVPVTLEYDKDIVRVKYSSKVKAVTPGQTCALYLGSECIGSGIISTLYRNNEKLNYL